MTELQTLVFIGVGVVVVELIKALTQRIFTGIAKSKDKEHNEVMECLNENNHLSYSLIAALSNMNSVPELELFSKQFRKNYLYWSKELRDNPDAKNIIVQ